MSIPYDVLEAARYIESTFEAPVRATVYVQDLIQEPSARHRSYSSSTRSTPEAIVRTCILPTSDESGSPAALSWRGSPWEGTYGGNRTIDMSYLALSSTRRDRCVLAFSSFPMAVDVGLRKCISIRFVDSSFKGSIPRGTRNELNEFFMKEALYENPKLRT